MDDSTKTADNIRHDITLLDRRYAIVELGERCFICHLPLLSRQFFVFPCQHAFHTDCLTGQIVKQAGVGLSRKIMDLQKEIQRNVQTSGGGNLSRERMIEEFDSLIAASWYALLFFFLLASFPTISLLISFPCLAMLNNILKQFGKD